MAPSQDDSIPYSVISQLINDAQKDPQLPRQNPTEAFWQSPPAPISQHRSPQLPSKTTYAIIGSGVTGCSVAKNLLELLPSDSKASITIFEARSLTSGATGRNGGHLLSPLPEEFCTMEKYLGKAEATKIGQFANRTLNSMHQLAAEDKELSRMAEARKVKSVCAYYDKEVFELAKKSHKTYEECLPEFVGDHAVFTAEEAVKEHNMKDSVGVIVNSAGAFWPYRLITGLFSRLLERYPSRFSIEAETPVTSILHEPTTDNDYPYIVTTPRGNIRASKVIHCTNGWTGHLLPNMRGKIFPLRGTMSTQESGSEFPNEGNIKSWSTVGKPTYNAKGNWFSYGLYYITQNSHTGDIFIGGERQKITDILSSDDTYISPMAKENLENVLPTIFDKGWRADEKPKVKKLWSGIMGFTPDHLPWVGRIPKSISGRDADGEYIAAGFNGYGMPLCWGAGEAVAKMLLGKEDELREWLPESFEMTSARLNSPYSTTEAGVWNLIGQEPGMLVTAKLTVKHLISTAYRTLFG